MRDVGSDIVYEPNYRAEHGFFKTWRIMASNIWGARFLIQQLFIRDFFAVYKKSFVGIAWILISPLIGIISWVFLQKTGMLNPGKLDIPYPAYVLMGTLAWDFFAGGLNSASNTLKSGTALVMQVNYPHEALLVKELAQFLSNYL
jgi:lipopolysaccharide transport system permease protein